LGSAEVPGSESTPSGFVVHVVESGETLSSIAAEYDVSVSAIRAANDLSPDDETIRAEQSLVIPVSTPAPTATPTADPNATATPAPSYVSPPLLYPPDGATLTDGAPVMLQWASVSVLEGDESYELYLWQPSGGVVSSTVRTRATAWRVPLDLLQKAVGDRPEFRWRVQVVRETAEQAYERAGAPSAPRSFVWQASAPAQLPTATSKP
jgi:LysM repeat protein